MCKCSFFGKAFIIYPYNKAEHSAVSKDKAIEMI